MLLEKVRVVDQIEVVENGCVQVRTRTSVLEDGVPISTTYHRHIVVPGADYSSEDSRVAAVCAAVHTPDVVAAYSAAMSSIDRTGPVDQAL